MVNFYEERGGETLLCSRPRSDGSKLEYYRDNDTRNKKMERTRCRRADILFLSVVIRIGSILYLLLLL